MEPIFLKPGESIHSTKWDNCVADVKANGKGVNAYAVCTAKLGDESFKSQYVKSEMAKSELWKARDHVNKFGIEGAGPVPNSLLAEQDLEEDFIDTWKNIITGTDKKIEAIGEEGKDEDPEDQELLADKIEDLQGKRQKATIKERKNMSKSFKDFWKNIAKDVSMWTCACGEKNRDGEDCPNCGAKQPD